MNLCLVGIDGPHKGQVRKIAHTPFEAGRDDDCTVWVGDNAFEAQVRRSPEAVAVEFGDERLTYRELDERSARVAHELRDSGVKPGTVVGLLMPRQPMAIAALLGILKSGAVYLPLDPAYPKERLAFMLEDARVSLVLTVDTLAGQVAETAVQVPAFDSRPATPDGTAYVIYTSGSTGTPKGVCVGYREASGHFATMREAYAIQPQDRVQQFASLSFDVSLEQIFVTLTSGATLVIADQDQWGAKGLSAYLRDARITVLNIPPAFWQQWTEEEIVVGHADFGAQLRLLIIGGDVAPIETVRMWQGVPATSSVRLLNAYGPTEATITSTLFDVPAGFGADASSTRVPIGRPLPGTEAHIMDADMRPVPPGEAGELYLGGNRLARGYLNREELTAQRFVPHPFSDQPGARLYRTGDLARYLPDGNIEFLGRADAQVKLRGFRIELGEIEAALLQHPEVRRAVVTRREDHPGSPYLAAYIVPQDADKADASALRDHARSRLPEYMAPSAFVFLDAFPMTSGGKVDRRALPAPERLDQTGPPCEIVAPRTELESLLAGIWRDVLRLDQLSVHDNFFELGGHSLLATRVIARVRDALRIELPLRRLFEAPTVAEFAEIAEEVLLDTLEGMSDDEATELLGGHSERGQ